MSTEILYLTIVPGRYYNQVRIARITKRKPTNMKAGQALVKLVIDLPAGALSPPTCTVQIKPEHIAPTPITVTSEEV